MPSDIRSFFGGKVPPKEVEPAKGSPGSAKRSKSGRKVVEDDSDDDGPIKRDLPNKTTTPKKAAREPSPQEETTTSDYFGKSKPKASAARTKGTPKQTPQTSPAKGNTSSTSTPSTRLSTRKKPPVDYTEPNGNSHNTGKDPATGGIEDDSDAFSDIVEAPSAKPPPKPKNTKSVKEDVEMTDADDAFVISDDEDIVKSKTSKSKKPASTAGKKRKSVDIDDEDEDEVETTPAKGKTSTPKKAPAKKKAKQEDQPENPAMQAIFDSIPLVRPPSPPRNEDGEKPKFKFGGAHANAGPPPAAGTFEMPDGAENCLAGLSFVFTGLLDKLGRPEGQTLVKRYGGKVSTAPSSKTSYVVLGKDAGPKKLEIIKNHNLKVINEDGLAELIRRLPANGGDSKAAAKYEEKKQAEDAKTKALAAEMDEADRKAKVSAAKATAAGGNAARKANVESADSRLWTVKYAPTSMSQICGNKSQVEKLQRWLKNFPNNQRIGFAKAGPDGTYQHRAVLISGPPGIGKTTAAHLVANLEGYDVVESNASDARSKKLIETGLRGVLSTNSLLGYFAGDGQKVDTKKKKLLLIMDEVDGMSAGDRGGVVAMAALCKKTEVPIILICNDKRNPKMKPLSYVTADLPFRRPTTEMMQARIKTIAFREGLDMPMPVLVALIEGTNADIRQVINMLSTAKLDAGSMDFDKSKQMSKAWQKHIVLKPWDILGQILGGGMFAAASKATLNDKIELYFNDHSLSFLMLQENYLGTTPVAASSYQGREKNLKTLELVEKAASSISDGDLVDRMIHGPDQLWTLMPTHAVFSFVRPASFVAGSMAGYGQSSFPQWLGKNSSQGKFLRQVKEIQGHMRLRAHADRHEIRQMYVPLLWAQLIKKLETGGKDIVPEVIDLMDSYFLTKDDWDSILELGVDYMGEDKVKLDSQTKAAFTRLYNQQSHPMPFMKPSTVAAKKSGKSEKPDIEEALDESDDDALVEAPEEDEEEDPLAAISKDKYVKQPKKKTGKAAGKGKKTKAADDDDDDEGEEEKPKKARGSAKGKGKAKK